MSLLHNPPVAGKSQHAQTVAAAAADARESAAASLSEYNNPPIITSMLSCSICPKGRRKLREEDWLLLLILFPP
jgi:hypothetical protein